MKKLVESRGFMKMMMYLQRRRNRKKSKIKRIVIRMKKKEDFSRKSLIISKPLQELKIMIGKIYKKYLINSRNNLCKKMLPRILLKSFMKTLNPTY